jgi:predicted transcriptional regulator
MKITLQLPPDLERQLLDSADRSQQTPEALIVQTLRQHLPLFPDSTGWPQL